MPYLRPATPDDLSRHPAPQAAASARQADVPAAEVPVPVPEPADVPETLLQPEPPVLPEPDIPAVSEPLFSFDATPEEPDDEDADWPDAIADDDLPIPACVPLFEEAAEKRRFPWWLVALAVLAAAAGAAWYFDVFSLVERMLSVWIA